MDADESVAGAVPAAKQVAGGVDEGKSERAADAAPSTAAPKAAADTVSDGDGDREGFKLKLSQSRVNCILRLEPEVVEDADEYYARMTSDPANRELFGQEYIDRHTAILRDLAEMSTRVFAEFEKFQAWARAEYEKKGYVEVDEDYIAQRVLLFEGMEEEEEEEEAGDVEGLVYADE